MPGLVQKISRGIESDSMLPGSMPRLPESIMARFGQDAKAYQDALDKWYNDVKSHMVRMIQLSQGSSSILDRLEDHERRLKALEE